uniref:Major facilitator superfamily (MFS) profile domain-containing protein n=1 Tax=Stomoxys calcitrans TaxID=35570 RepID=A0A1I8PGX5_STOCA
MGDSFAPGKKDAATETSQGDVTDLTIITSEMSNESAETLRNLERFGRHHSFRVADAATVTDFPMVNSLTVSFTTTLKEEIQDKRESLDSFKDLPSTSSSEQVIKHQRQFALKSSKSQHVSRVDSIDDRKDKRFTLGHSKSQYSPRFQGYDEEDDLAISNLQKGNVFVYMIIPPDGGYGWFIMFISFCCQIVVDGIIFGIGVILPYIAQEFGVPGSKVVLVASMQVGFYFLSGTLSSAFINKFGFRPVALAGCLLSITLLMVATFSINLPMMIISYSILGGPSLSMIWVSSQLIIGYYFEKYRPIANGLSCSGAGAGIMMFAYMNNVLVVSWGWRNLMRLHVAFLLLVFLMVLTFVEVAPTKVGRMKEANWDDTDSDSYDSITDMIRYSRYSRYSLKRNEDIHNMGENFQNIMEKMEDLAPTLPQHKGCFATCLKSCCPCLQSFLQHPWQAPAQEAQHYVIRQDLMERQDLFYMGPRQGSHDIDAGVSASTTTTPGPRKSVIFGPTEVHTISLNDIDEKINSKRIINRLSTMTLPRSMADHRKSYKELQQTHRFPLLAFLRPKNLIHPKIRNAFNMLFDFRLLAIMEFRVLLASAFLFPMGFNIPFVYSTVRVQIEPSFAKLISPSIGFSNFAFRIASGFVAYKFREHTTFICGGGMVFGGVAVLASAFYGHDVVWFQFLYAICYGIAPAFYSTLRAIIYVRSLGLDKLTNAFGLTALAMGMGVFIGTTAGGILNDLTGDYTASFAFAGICIIVAGSLKLLLPHLRGQ